MKKFLLALLLAFLPTMADAQCNSNCAADTVCDWNTAGSWTSGGSPVCTGVPDTAAEDVDIAAGDIISYKADADGSMTIGQMTLDGELTFSEDMSSNVTADGFRILVVTAPTPTADTITIGAAGVLRMRAGHRIDFDTTAGVATEPVTDGGLVNLQGSIHKTKVLSIVDIDADTVCQAAGEEGRKWTIEVESGLEFAQQKRRVVFESGMARARHYEIVNANPQTDGNIVLCTEFEDVKSGGQQLLPHTTTGSTDATWTAIRHLIPSEDPVDLCTGADAPFDCCTAADVGVTCNDNIILPKVGDDITIIQDVWFTRSAGANGYNFTWASAGTNTQPKIFATHWNDAGIATLTCLLTRSLTAGLDGNDISYNNIHDYICGNVIRQSGFDDYTMEWNTVHDAAAGVTATAAVAILASDHSAVVGATADRVKLNNNFVYHTATNGIDINVGGVQTPAQQSVDCEVTGNIVFGGCTRDDECVAIEINNCTNGYIAHNVIYDWVKLGNTDGAKAIQTPGANGTLTNHTGTVYHRNWVVNVSGSCHISTQGDLGGNASQLVTFTQNYCSHSLNNLVDGGRIFGGVYKNAGLQNANEGGDLIDQIVLLKGAYLVATEEDIAGADCGTGCIRSTVHLGDTTGNNSAFAGGSSPVTIQDNVIAGKATGAAATRGLIFEDGTADYDIIVDHNTCDGRESSGQASCINYLNTTDSGDTLTFTNLAVTHGNNDDAVRCQTNAGQTFNVDDILRNISNIATEDTNPVAAACGTPTSQTLKHELGFKDRLGGDYNWLPGANGLTLGSPAPLGVRALRFDRAKITDYWGGALPFDGEMPVDIENSSNVDTDGDGVIDLHDNCNGHWNPSQLDTNENGIGDACS